MDFHSLARRDLQLLCKKNRIPANQTNIAMASALQALETVEGIKEIQEALGFLSPKKPEAKSPELPRTSRRTSVHRSSHGDEPKIQEQLASSQPWPLPVAVKALEVIEMASKEEEGEKKELPRTSRRTVHRSSHGDEPKIQEQLASSLSRPLPLTVKALEVIEMASKEEEGEKKEAPKHFPKTPATTRRTSMVQEAPCSMTKANQKDDGSIGTPTSVHTGRTRQVRRVAAETSKVVESRKGKSTGVMTRRSTLPSSRKAVEETATAKAKSRSSRSRAKEAVKVSALAKEGAEEQETVEEKKYSAENGDSTDVLVEDVGKNDQEVKSHGISSSLDVENSKVEVLESIEEEAGENNQEVGSHDLSSLLDPEEEDAGKELVDASLLEKSSSMAPLSVEIESPEEKSTEVKESTISNEASAFVEDSSEQTPKDEALKDSSSSGAKVKISADTEVLLSCGVEKERDEQDASSISKNSTSETDLVKDVTNGSSETSYIELPKEAEESIYSPPTVVAPEDALLDSKNLDALSDLCDEPLATEGIGVSFAFASESPNKVKDVASDHTSEILVVTEESIDRDLQDAGEIEVSVEMLHETVTLQDVKGIGSNLTGEILEVLPQEASELAAKEFVDLPPRESEDTSIDIVLMDASKLEVSVEMLHETVTLQNVKDIGGNLLEVPPQEAGKLAVKESEDTSIDRVLQDASKIEVSVEILHETLQDVKEIGGILTGEILEVPPQEAGELTATESVDVPPRGSEDTSIDRVLQDASKLEVSVEMLHETLQDVKEIGGNLTGEILEVPPQEAGELFAKEFVDVLPQGSEDISINRVLHDASKLEVSVELLQEVKETGGNTRETLEVEEFLNVLQQESEIFRDTSFETSATVTVGPIAESVDEGKETSDEFPIKIAAVIEKPTESMEVLQISVPSTELSVEFSAAENSSVAIITETLPETEEGAYDHSNESVDEGKETSGEFPIKIAAVIEEPTESMEVLQISVPSTELSVEFSAAENSSAAIITETLPQTEEGADDHSNEFSIVQIQLIDSEVADLAAVEMAEEKEDIKDVEMQKSLGDENVTAWGVERSCIRPCTGGESKNEVVMVEEIREENKALGKDKSVKDEKLVDLSLAKLRAMYKQKLDDRKNEVERSLTNSKLDDRKNEVESLTNAKLDDRKNEVSKQADLQCLSHSKFYAMYKQKLDDRKNEVKQEDLQCLSHSKLHASTQKLNDDRNKVKQDLQCLSSHSKLHASTQKLNDDRNKLRKRTPLKNLN